MHRGECANKRFGEFIALQTIPDIKQGPISVDSLYEMVGSAMNIPSAAMGQPTQFVVLNDIEILSRVAGIVQVPAFTMQALAAIIVCGDVNMAQVKDKWTVDCEAAAQQLLFAAHANGLGAYISSLYPDRDRIDGITVLFNLPENIVAHSYVSLGYPAKVPSARDSFRNERVHYNGWVRRKSTF